jgi:methyl coenzyme M reductase subunit C
MFLTLTPNYVDSVVHVLMLVELGPFILSHLVKKRLIVKSMKISAFVAGIVPVFVQLKQ